MIGFDVLSGLPIDYQEANGFVDYSQKARFWAVPRPLALY